VFPTARLSRFAGLRSRRQERKGNLVFAFRKENRKATNLAGMLNAPALYL